MLNKYFVIRVIQEKLKKLEDSGTLGAYQPQIQRRLRQSWETMKRPIYFDQAGTCVKKFGIRQVPARVFQKGELLEISEEMVL